MSGEVAAEVAAVLADHAWTGSDEQKVDGAWTWGGACECGEFVPDDKANAHLAEALAPLITERVRAAQAEAWDFGYVHGLSDETPNTNPYREVSR